MSASYWTSRHYDQRCQLGLRALLFSSLAVAIVMLIVQALVWGVWNPLFFLIPLVVLPFVMCWPGIPRDHWLVKSPHVRQADAVRTGVGSVLLVGVAQLHAEIPSLPIAPLLLVAIGLNAYIIKHAFVGAALVYTSFATSVRTTWSFVAILLVPYPPDEIVRAAMRDKRGLTEHEQLLLDLYLRDILIQSYFPPPVGVSRTYRARVRAYTASALGELHGVEAAISRLRQERQEEAEQAHSTRLKKFRDQLTKQQENSHGL